MIQKFSEVPFRKVLDSLDIPQLATKNTVLIFSLYLALLSENAPENKQTTFEQQKKKFRFI